MKAALTKADFARAPSRGDNGKAGDAKTPGTVVANTRSRPTSPTSQQIVLR